MTTSSTAALPRTWRLLACMLAVALLAAIVRLAWLGDDAFITFRSVENLVHGHGPVWNVGERVQTYTHPLWYWLLCLVRWCSGECEWTTMGLGILLSAGAMAAVALRLGSAAAACVWLALLLGSRAWTSYATSGLETSLTYLLLGLLFAAARGTDAGQRLARTALVTGLLALTRLDLLVLGLPVVVAQLRGVGRARALRLVLPGLAPLAAWSGFAAVYYGSPFPITAYAKAFCHGVPAGELALQGLRYLWRNTTDDPVTPVVIACGALLGLRRPGDRSFALGALLYTAYVVKVGGDYMLGRFLVPSFTVAAVLLARALAPATAGRQCGVALGALALAVVPGIPEAATPLPRASPGYEIGVDGIVDEQRQGHWDHGLLSRGAARGVPGHIGDMLRRQGVTRRVFTLGGWIGWLGYTSGPQVHVVDPWLGDPLLMRLPVAEPDQWRIGHFVRRIPAGYLESLASGENRIPHPGLARAWDAVRSATRDPIWSAARWGHLWDLWTGRHEDGLADFVATGYRTPPRREVPLAELQRPPGKFWFDPPVGRTAQAGGLAVRLPAPSDAAQLVLHLSGGADYRVRFLREGVVTGEVSSRPTVVPPDLLQAERIAVPVAARPFDTLWLDAAVDPWRPAAAFVGRIELAP
jgi:arabinofuranosyltransferase